MLKENHLQLFLHQHFALNYLNSDCRLCYCIQRSLTTDAIDFDSIVKTPNFPGCFHSFSLFVVVGVNVVVVSRSRKKFGIERKPKEL